MQIEGRDYVFNQGDTVFLNRNTSHGEIVYRRDMVVIRLLLSYSFFDGTLNLLDTAEETTEKFQWDFLKYLKKGNRDFFFVRFAPGTQGTKEGGGINLTQTKVRA